MKLSLKKNKKGSALVDKIMLTAFSVAAAGAVTIYTIGVISNSKNQNLEDEFKTYNYNQIARVVPSSPTNYNGLFRYQASDGVITCTSLKENRIGADGLFHSVIAGYSSLVGHKALFKAEIYSSMSVGISTYGIRPSQSTNQGIPNEWSPISTIWTTEVTSTNHYWFYKSAEVIPEGTVIKLRNIQLFDLTVMYGNGNEPGTVEEFTSNFPKNFYPYQVEPQELTKSQINNLGI